MLLFRRYLNIRETLNEVYRAQRELRWEIQLFSLKSLNLIEKITELLTDPRLIHICCHRQYHAVKIKLTIFIVCNCNTDMNQQTLCLGACEFFNSSTFIWLDLSDINLCATKMQLLYVQLICPNVFLNT